MSLPTHHAHHPQPSHRASAGVRPARPPGRLADDTGAQAMEYAMLSGAAAAACGGIGILLRSEAFQDFLREILGSLGTWITGFIG